MGWRCWVLTAAARVRGLEVASITPLYLYQEMTGKCQPKPRGGEGHFHLPLVRTVLVGMVGNSQAVTAVQYGGQRHLRANLDRWHSPWPRGQNCGDRGGVE